MAKQSLETCKKAHRRWLVLVKVLDETPGKPAEVDLQMSSPKRPTVVNGAADMISANLSSVYAFQID